MCQSSVCPSRIPSKLSPRQQPSRTTLTDPILSGFQWGLANEEPHRRPEEGGSQVRGLFLPPSLQGCFHMPLCSHCPSPGSWFCRTHALQVSGNVPFPGPYPCGGGSSWCPPDPGLLHTPASPRPSSQFADQFPSVVLFNEPPVVVLFSFRNQMETGGIYFLLCFQSFHVIFVLCIHFTTL